MGYRDDRQSSSGRGDVDVNIAALWLGMIVLALLQVPLMVRYKQWRELVAFDGMWLLAGFYATLVVVDMRVINPFEIIELILTGFYGILRISL